MASMSSDRLPDGSDDRRHVLVRFTNGSQDQESIELISRSKHHPGLGSIRPFVGFFLARLGPTEPKPELRAGSGRQQGR